MRSAVWLVVVVACAGCFRKPGEPAHGDAPGRDTPSVDVPRPDAPPCVNGWTYPPTPIVPAGFDSVHDAATSPWLSDSNDDLWFARLPNGNGPPQMMHSQLQNGVWQQPLSSTADDDDPFVVGGTTLWFDNSGNGLFIEEAPVSNLGAPTSHLADLGNGAREPWVSADGKLILFAEPDPSTLVLRIFAATRANAVGAFSSPREVMFAGSEAIESPSYDNLGTLYFTDHSSSANIYTAAFSGMVLTNAQLFGSFQLAGGLYFDPNLSTDGRTLVFAARPPGAPYAGIYYVMRCP